MAAIRSRGSFPWPGSNGFPRRVVRGIYRWRALLHRVEALANASNATWCVHHDADEIRRSPRPGESLLDAFARMDAEGYNAADHRVFCFHPTDELYAGDPEHTSAITRTTAWTTGCRTSKRGKTWVLSRSLGAQGTRRNSSGRRIHPEKLILKHYPIRSSLQGARKVLGERVPRFDPAERAMQWHVQYDSVARTKQWLHDPITLKEWTRMNVEAVG